jgi:hypothetical protein
MMECSHILNPPFHRHSSAGSRLDNDELSSRRDITTFSVTFVLKQKTCDEVRIIIVDIRTVCNDSNKNICRLTYKTRHGINGNVL